MHLASCFKQFIDELSYLSIVYNELVWFTFVFLSSISLMQVYTVPLEATQQFSSLVLDYINGDEFLKGFYSYSPVLKSYEEKILERIQVDTNREVLVDGLKEQYSLLNSPVGSKVNQNLGLLSNKNTFTITTGHQLNLMTGPLYSIYKILTVIKITEILSEKFPQYKFIPVFWMASEDHDIDEIDHLFVKSRKYEWKTSDAGAAGRLSTNSLSELFSEMKTQAPELELSLLFNSMEKAYLSHDNLAKATFEVINSLFGEYGLVVIDADRLSFKKLLLDEFKADLLDEKVHGQVTHANTQLSKKYKLLVNPREINLFYLLKNQRERIVKNESNEYVVQNTDIKFSQKEILEELNNHPDRFSPNVIMRTIYQEKLLPNLSYVGGPGEISYWLQFKSAFKKLSIPYPILQLRCGFVLIDKKGQKLRKQLNLEYNDLFQDINILIENSIVDKSKLLNFEQVEEQIRKVYEAIELIGSDIDKSLVYPIRGECQKSVNSVSKLQKKFIRALKRKDDKAISRLHELQKQLFPNGVFQERLQNILTFSSIDHQKLIEVLYNNTEPFSKDLKIIELDE